ncbi:copper resistance protein B [Dyella silvatica]|uniref:copper resistance protein B n=1 Tax=Dyella silvatica TaxID=2992128 RepID=UPI0022521A35|nr:copper resistance protein B [Dyella silvatica]
MSARKLVIPLLGMSLWPLAAMAGQATDAMPGMLMPAATPPTHHRVAKPAKPAAKPDADPHAGMDMSMPGMDHSDGAQPMVMPDTSVLPPNSHVAPAAPQLQMPEMSAAHMVDVMQMDDTGRRGMLLLDRLERSRSTGGDYATSWEAEGWWGSDTNRLWLKTEGERRREGTQDGRAEVLWGHATSTFWDWQLGVRQDFAHGPSRPWAALGVQGLAPYWFASQATFYIGPNGRTAARFEGSYDLLFTQRLILTPKLELNFYRKNDPRRDISSGLSDAQAGLRLRYEFSRRLAPYVGVNWAYRHSNGVGMENQPTRETTWVAGVRIWL